MLLPSNVLNAHQWRTEIAMFVLQPLLVDAHQSHVYLTNLTMMDMQQMDAKQNVLLLLREFVTPVLMLIHAPRSLAMKTILT